MLAELWLVVATALAVVALTAALLRRSARPRRGSRAPPSASEPSAGMPAPPDAHCREMFGRLFAGLAATLSLAHAAADEIEADLDDLLYGRGVVDIQLDAAARELRTTRDAGGDAGGGAAPRPLPLSSPGSVALAGSFLAESPSCCRLALEARPPRARPRRARPPSPARRTHAGAPRGRRHRGRARRVVHRLEPLR